MYNPFTFMHEGTRYVTLIGLDINDTIRITDVMNYKNAMPFGVFLTSKVNPKNNMEKQAGKQLNKLTIYDAISAEQDEDGYWLVEAEKDGQKFKLTRTAVYIDGKLEAGEGDKSEVADVDEAAPTAEEETAPEPPAVPIPESKEESATEDDSTNKNIKIAVIGGSSVTSTLKEALAGNDDIGAVVVEANSQSETLQKIAEITPEERAALLAPIEDEKEPEFPVTDAKSFYGISFKGSTQKREPFIIGGQARGESLQIGVEFTSQPTYTPPRQRRRTAFADELRPAGPKTRYPWQRVEEVPEVEKAKPVQPFVPSGVPAVAPDIVDKEQKDAAWGANAPMDRTERLQKLSEMAPMIVDAPADIAPAEPVQVAPDENKELKEAFRSTLSPEINKVIGDIPHSILGTIEAFSTNDIDRKDLEQRGELYCIDHRWQKCGKWFCIDIVNHYSRYFFNAKLGASLEIPIATCKEWLKIVSGNV